MQKEEIFGSMFNANEHSVTGFYSSPDNKRKKPRYTGLL